MKKKGARFLFGDAIRPFLTLCSLNVPFVRQSNNSWEFKKVTKLLYLKPLTLKTTMIAERKINFSVLERKCWFHKWTNTHPSLFHLMERSYVQGKNYSVLRHTGRKPKSRRPNSKFSKRQLFQNSKALYSDALETFQNIFVAKKHDLHTMGTLELFKKEFFIFWAQSSVFANHFLNCVTEASFYCTEV